VQQLKEAFPESCAYRYRILDRDAKFGTEAADLLAVAASSLYARALPALGKMALRNAGSKVAEESFSIE
jgi:hypothetical protein